MKQFSNRGLMTRLLALAVTATGAVASFYLAMTLSSLRSVSAQVHAQPFYLERTIPTPDRNGNLLPSRKEILARRSDGATARLDSVGPLDSARFLRKLLFLDGSSVTLADSVGSKTTWPQMSELEVAAMKGRLLTRLADCGVRAPYTILGFDTMSGQDVVIVQRIIPGRYRLTRWLAPQLGCEDLSYESEAINADGTFSISADARVSQLKLGEPEARLFDFGKNFLEMKPSEVQKRFQQEMGLKLTAEQEKQAEIEGQLADMEYQRKRPTQ